MNRSILLFLVFFHISPLHAHEDYPCLYTEEERLNELTSYRAKILDEYSKIKDNDISKIIEIENTLGPVLRNDGIHITEVGDYPGAIDAIYTSCMTNVEKDCHITNSCMVTFDGRSSECKVSLVYGCE